MADWPPKKNAQFVVVFPIFDADGDLVVSAAGLDSEVSKDGGAFTDCTNEATEIGTSGIYALTLTAAEMNADTIAVITKTSTTGAKTAVNVMYTATRQLIDLAYPAVSGRALEISASGLTAANVQEWRSALPNALASGLLQTRVDAYEASVDFNSVQKASINVEADTALSDIHLDHLLAVDYDPAAKPGVATALLNELVENDSGVSRFSANTLEQVWSVAARTLTDLGFTLDTADFAASFLTAGLIAADAIGASELASDAALEIADAVLQRDMDQVESSAPVHSLVTAILKAVSRIRDNAGSLEIYRTDGTTVHATQAVTTDSNLEPIDELGGAV